jgi:hypothetical protein
MLKVIMLENAENKIFSLIFFLNIPLLSRSLLTSLTTWASFRLSDFDPDKSNFTIEEWLEDASKLKGELGASDLIMIAKAGEALRG